MYDLDVLLKGVVAGLAISVPVGPVNVLCLSRTLAKGRTAGLIAGVGAAAADTVYGAIAGFSVRYVIGFLIQEETWVRLIGGILLIGIGVVYYLRRPTHLKDMAGEEPGHSDWASAFLLNLTNPTTVLSFMAVLSALGLQHGPWWQGMTLVGGIFIGAMLWWASLAATADHFRSRLTDRATIWMNRIAGIAIGGFGVVTLALSRAWAR